MSKLIKGKVLGWAAMRSENDGAYWFPLIYEDSRARLVTLEWRPAERFIAHRDLALGSDWCLTDALTGAAMVDRLDSCWTIAEAVDLAEARIRLLDVEKGRASFRARVGCPPEADV